MAWHTFVQRTVMNRYRLSWVCCFCYILFSYTSILAQPKASINGKLVKQDKPIAFASLILYTSSDTLKPISTAISDSLGNFELNGMPLGKYRLNIRSIGFLPKIMELQITSANSVLNLGNISLVDAGETLKSVTVTSEKKLIQRTSQGFVVNASASITQLGVPLLIYLEIHPLFWLMLRALLPCEARLP